MRNPLRRHYVDEPFSGLDPINAQALKDAVVELRRRGKTVLLSTHVMENAERMCDSVCIIARGEKVLDGAIAEVRAEHGRRNVAIALGAPAVDGVSEILRDPRFTRRVDDNGRFFEIELRAEGDARDLLRRLVGAGADIERFELVQPSLHQIFLERVGAQGVEAGVSGHG